MDPDGVPGFSGMATTHGVEQFAAAGFDDTDVALIRAGSSYEQGVDGATVYVSQSGEDAYNLLIENESGAVTAHRGMSFDDLNGLARNYDWVGRP